MGSNPFFRLCFSLKYVTTASNAAAPHKVNVKWIRMGIGGLQNGHTVRFGAGNCKNYALLIEFLGDIVTNHFFMLNGYANVFIAFIKDVCMTVECYWPHCTYPRDEIILKYMKKIWFFKLPFQKLIGFDRNILMHCEFCRNGSNNEKLKPFHWKPQIPHLLKNANYSKWITYSKHQKQFLYCIE